MLRLILARGQAAREANRLRVAVRCQLVDHRPAGVAQVQNPGHFVVGFAGGVIDGGAQFGDVTGDVTNMEQRGMPTGHQQRGQFARQRAVVEQIHRDMPHEVIESVQRLVQSHGQRLGGGQANHQCPHQARTRSHRDRIHLRQIDVGSFGGASKCRHQRLKVSSASHFGHHPAETHMFGHGGRHLVGQQLMTAHDPDTGLVATGFDAQHQRADAAADATFTHQAKAHSEISSPTGRSMTQASWPGP